MIVGTPSNTDWSLQRYEILQNWNRKAEVHWGNAYIYTSYIHSWSHLTGLTGKAKLARGVACDAANLHHRAFEVTCVEAWWSSTFGSVESSATNVGQQTCWHVYSFACTEIAKRWRKIPRVTSSQTCYDICPIALCTSYVLPAPFLRVIMPWQGILPTLASWTRARKYGHARAKCLPSVLLDTAAFCDFEFPADTSC